jgi:hypothetical protein
MNRTLFLSIVGSLLLLTACGGNEGLTVRGEALVDVADPETHTGFGPFAVDTRLDTIEATSEGRITGSCEMRRTLDDAGMRSWGVIARIQAPTQPGLALSSLTLIQNSAAEPSEGRVEAELGTTLYTSETTACAIEVPYAIGEDDGVVAFEGTCDLADAAGNTARATIDLHFEGCTVADGSD